jgi:hypothetical protein
MSTPSITQINIAAQKADLVAGYRALVDAMTTELPDVTSVLVAKVSYTKADLIKEFQARIDAWEATKNARMTLHTMVAAERQVQLQVVPLRAGMKAFLSLRFGKNSPEIQKFGFTQIKKTQKTVQAKATGVANAIATRAARSTMGKKQKSAISGTPMTVVAEPAATVTKSPKATTAPATPSAATSSTQQPTPAAAPAPKATTPAVTP